MTSRTRNRRRGPPRPVRSRLGALCVAAVGLALIVPAGTAGPAASGRPAASVAAQAATQAPTSSVALVADPGGFDQAFYRGTDDAVYRRTFRDGTWSAQSSVGGRIVGAPGVAMAGSTLVVGGRGTDGALWMRTSRQGTWGSWQSLGGVVSAAPGVAVGADGRIDVFGRGGDDQLWTRSQPAGGTWSPWTSLGAAPGGPLRSGPVALSPAAGRVDVYATLQDQAVWTRSRSGGTWSAWRSLGGRTYSAPAAAWSQQDGAAWVFARGTNNALYLRRGASSSWTSVGGASIDAPAAAATAGGGVDVVVRGTDTALWSRRYRSGTWTSWARAWAAAAPPAPAASLRGMDWTRIPTTAPVVALTFDAGGDASGLTSIRRTLERQNVPATFFLTGAFARAFPAQANEVAVAGFVIGNHSDTHPHFPQLTDARARAEVQNAQQAILRANGAESRPLFRFPFGDVNAHMISLVNGLAYVPVRWTVDSLGWQGTSGGMTAQRVVDRVLGALQPGEIVLMHVGANPDDGTTLDADALPRIIDAIRARGYRFVTLDALTG